MSFVISTFALFIVSITMLCRANDLRLKSQWKWRVRLVGFMLAGVMPVGMVIEEFVSGAWPSPYEAMFRVGLAFVFTTTPYMVPWWRFISGKEDAHETN